MVVAASSVGTVFEWYDFFIYGTLGAILSKAFFPTGNATLEMLLFWLVFAVGFGFRPMGAVMFGILLTISMAPSINKSGGSNGLESMVSNNIGDHVKEALDLILCD
jgi:ABC-type transport system involved in multi-copper enzyme maturation permease subunit